MLSTSKLCQGMVEKVFDDLNEILDSLWYKDRAC